MFARGQRKHSSSSLFPCGLGDFCFFVLLILQKLCCKRKATRQYVKVYFQVEIGVKNHCCTAAPGLQAISGMSTSMITYERFLFKRLHHAARISSEPSRTLPFSLNLSLASSLSPTLPVSLRPRHCVPGVVLLELGFTIPIVVKLSYVTRKWKHTSSSLLFK